MAKRKVGKRWVHDIESVNDRYKKAVTEISQRGEKALTMIMIAIQNRAAEYTPQDSNNLINSQYRRVMGETPSQLQGRVGYTAGYAARLHDNMDWKLLTPAERRPRGGAYNPMGQPFFLRRGADEAVQNDVPTILRAIYGDQ